MLVDTSTLFIKRLETVEKDVEIIKRVLLLVTEKLNHREAVREMLRVADNEG
jgi:hypothetical protein